MAKKEKIKESLTQQAAMIAEAKESMNTALKQKFMEIQHSLESGKSANILSMFEAGLRCKEVSENPDKYGKNGLKLLEQAFRKKKRLLVQAARFAMEYTKEEVAKIVQFKNESLNFSISWEHIKALLSSDLPKAQRDTYIQRTLKEGWTARELFDAIRKETGVRVNHGRTHSRPTTKGALMDQIKRLAEQWLKKDESVWNATENPATDDLRINIKNITSDEYMTFIDLCQILSNLELSVAAMKATFLGLRSEWKTAHDAGLKEDMDTVVEQSGDLPARGMIEGELSSTSTASDEEFENKLLDRVVVEEI